ncbi:hypothetical protein [Methylobacterium platani]|uniref:Uncharacterized protein n=2 Tax=Methylobacterium platani TaxID=427683 RepID=A0A179S5X2_9HYPH|nr:hypothetical protein [Methylobacterium platani]KMO20654.1 hypothetical protein SQ03_05380 [Methylobacterium platani JCM 14648]OAS22190.1 hypothetical protein A5481_19660 [Methylobacterium platani]
MALPTWPAGLPPLRGLASSAGSDSLHPEAQSTQFDDGPDRTRRRTLFVTTPLAMQLRLSPAQFVAFKAFHLNDLNTGARRFTAPVLLPDMSIGTRTCQIRGKVAWSAPKKFEYLVSFTLVVQDW